MLVLKDLVELHKTFQFSFFSITGWGIDLDYHDIEWFALETNRSHSVIFEIASKFCILDSFFACYFANKGPSSQGYGFPVVTHWCESWNVKKAERRRIDAFELWCWRRLLRVPWTAKRSNKSILKETGPRCSLEGLMLKLKLQYFGHLMRRVDSLEKTLILGGVGSRRRRG